LRVQDSTARDSTTGRGGRGAGGGGGGAGRGAAGRGDAPVRRADLDIQDLNRIDVVVSAAGVDSVARLLPARPWQTRPSADWTARESPDFNLSDLYTTRGLYRDTNQDLVPDHMEGHVSLHGTESPAAAI